MPDPQKRIRSVPNAKTVQNDCRNAVQTGRDQPDKRGRFTEGLSLREEGKRSESDKRTKQVMVQHRALKHRKISFRRRCQNRDDDKEGQQQTTDGRKPEQRHPTRYLFLAEQKDRFRQTGDRTENVAVHRIITEHIRPEIKH